MKYFLYLILSISLYGSSNFTKSENVVIDLTRNIMWQDNIEVIEYKSSWSLAKEYCNELTLNGYTDWKLPSIKELLRIVNIKRANPAIFKEFKYVEPTSYWSNSQDMSNKNYAWYIGFKTGAVFKDSKDYDCYVRCVRSRFKK
ncbi:MAG: DUF1566 domain-containing protein [Campylobacterota bacterium]|nr:DUF1566 domain-containing protein [Campylobacterota bacterium]